MAKDPAPEGRQLDAPDSERADDPQHLADHLAALDNSDHPDRPRRGQAKES